MPLTLTSWRMIHGTCWTHNQIKVDPNVEVGPIFLSELSAEVHRNCKEPTVFATMRKRGSIQQITFPRPFVSHFSFYLKLIPVGMDWINIWSNTIKWCKTMVLSNVFGCIQSTIWSSLTEPHDAMGFAVVAFQLITCLLHMYKNGLKMASYAKMWGLSDSVPGSNVGRQMEFHHSHVSIKHLQKMSVMSWSVEFRSECVTGSQGCTLNCSSDWLLGWSAGHWL